MIPHRVQMCVQKRASGVYSPTVLRDNLARIGREPALLAIEVAWRWMFGTAALMLLFFASVQLQRAVVIGPDEEAQLASMSPVIMAQALAAILVRMLPVAIRLAAMIVPALVVLWTTAASVGRAVILTRLVGPERARLRWSGVVGTHFLRALSVVGLGAGYIGTSFLTAALADPATVNLLLNTLVFLVIFSGVFAAWVWVHWVLSLATMFPVTEGAGTGKSVVNAFRLVRTRGKQLTAISTANGFARSIVALIFTLLGLLPLPLYWVAPRLLFVMEVVVLLLYCVISDWLLLARLVAYLEVATSTASTQEEPSQP